MELRRLLRSHAGARSASPRLGELETRVMGVFWAGRADLSVRAVLALFDEELAYTTLMTTLDRLFKKGLLERRKEGRAFLYSAAVSRRELAVSATALAIRALLAGDAEPVLSGLVDAVTMRDLELLDTLERLVSDRRRELRGGEPD